MAQKWVTITHPKQDGDATAQVTQAAFDAVWKPRGFVIVKNPASTATDKKE